jgi:hypothetical protein
MTLNLSELAATANLAPSVHNTQPTRWRLDGDGVLWLLAERARRLKVGDPAGRDLAVSVGAALEATGLALMAQGLAIGRVDLLPGSGEALEPVVRVELAPTDKVALPEAVRRRATWRRGFAPVATDRTRMLGAWAEAADDVTLVGEPAELAVISDLNERASLKVYRNTAYRAELVSWMRLSKIDPRFGVDGLSATALGLSGFEAFGAGIALREPWFEWLDRVGMAAGLVSEATKTKGSAAVLVFHRPVDEHPVETGRHLYRRLLELTGLGFFTWPMAVLGDDPEAAAELRARYRVPGDRRIITAWRTGALPAGAQVARERLPVDALIV